MNANRRKVLKEVLYSGACMTAPLTIIASLSKGGESSYQSNIRINPLGDNMYEIDGWVVSLLDLRVT